MPETNNKKTFSSYLIPVITSLLTGAIMFLSGYIFSLNGEFRVSQEVDRNQSLQIVSILEQLDKNTDDRYKGSDAKKDRELVEEKFRSVRNQIADIKDMLKRMDKK